MGTIPDWKPVTYNPNTINLPYRMADTMQARQDYVDYLGGTRLILPPRRFWRKLPFKELIFVSDPDSTQSEEAIECRIEYEIVRSVFDYKSDQIIVETLKRRSLFINYSNL